MSEPPAVDAAGITYAYRDRRALSDVGFRVQPCGVHGFLGPNGSGKSTLFKLLATMLPLQAGEVRALGLDLRREPAALRRRLGVVFQSPAVDRKLTVRENLVYAGYLYGLRGPDLEARIGGVLERAGLTDRARDLVGELSGGLRRRVELAKGLMHEPELLLLDEPSTGLDPGARRDVWRFLREMEGATILFTTHLMEEAEEAGELTILDRGTVVARGSPAELKARVGGEIVELTCVGDRTDEVARIVEARTGERPVRLQGSLRIQREGVHRLVPELVEALGDRVERIAVSQPSLEDVFIRETGHVFAGEREGP